MCKPGRNRNPVRSSIQIWYKDNSALQNPGTPDPATSLPELDMDVNIWRIKERKRNVFIDFGLKVNTYKKKIRVYIYFPFDVDKETIEDLGASFESEQILKGIFNENYVRHSLDNNPKNALVSDVVKGDTLFSIYTLNIENDLLIEKKYGGTIVSFDVENIKDTNVKYYRFRINAKSLAPFIEHYKPHNTFFESAFIETELIDFRINEKRNQDTSLIEEIAKNNRFIIKNIHLFVMTPIKDEVVSDGINLIYKRQLEMGGFWEPYLKTKYEKMSVYKCNTTKSNADGIDDYSCFAKINYRKSNIGTLAIYLIVLLLVTVAFTVLSNIVWHFIEPVEWKGMI